MKTKDDKEKSIYKEGSNLVEYILAKSNEELTPVEVMIKRQTLWFEASRTGNYKMLEEFREDMERTRVQRKESWKRIKEEYNR